MKITKQNYERFLIDFMDGVLDPSVKESLSDFLDKNPEIKAEFDDLEIINTAVETDISFDHKETLKKSQLESTKNIHENNYEEYCIASAELDLTMAEEKELTQFISLNPDLAKNYQLFKKTKVQTDLSIIYADKNALKKYPFYQRKAWYYTASAAAASILIFISVLFFSKHDELKQTNFAQENRIAVPKSMEYISIETAITIPTENFTINYRSISTQTFASLEDFIIPEEKIQMLRARSNTLEQFASLKIDFQGPLFIPQRNLQTYSVFMQSHEQTNYAQAQDNNNKPVKAILKGLFSKFKRRKKEGGSEDGNAKKVGSLWVLASIGLERVNEVTGANMRLNSKIGEGNPTDNNENTDLELSRSAN